MAEDDALHRIYDICASWLGDDYDTDTEALTDIRSVLAELEGE